MSLRAELDQRFKKMKQWLADAAESEGQRARDGSSADGRDVPIAGWWPDGLGRGLIGRLVTLR